MDAWYAQLVNQSGDLIFTLDPQGRIVRMNPAFQSVLGADSSISGLTFPDFLVKEQQEKCEDMIQAVLEGRSWTGDLVLQSRDGKRWVFSVHAFPQWEDGTVAGMHGIARDVTRRSGVEQRLQEETAQQELAIMELEEANQFKSEFLSNTSHELRTPLNSIIGFLGIIQDSLTESREEELDLVHNARLSATHLLGLINDILDVAKIEAGRMTVNLEPVYVEDLVREVVALTRVQAEQKHLDLVVARDLRPLPRVMADHGKLKQVLINVVGNAVKFTDAGSITIDAQQATSGADVRISVRDTGIGIEPRDLKMIFGKFSQVDSSFTRTHGGTGLGLSITRSLMELMHGSILVDSDGKARGTTVDLFLPVAPDEDD